MSGWVVVCRNRRCQRAFEVDREGWDFPGSTSTLVSISFLYYTEVDLSSLVISARFCCMLQRPALRSGIVESQNGLSCKRPWSTPIPNPLPWAGLPPPSSGCPGPIQPDLEHLQGQGSHSSLCSSATLGLCHYLFSLFVLQQMKCFVIKRSRPEAELVTQLKRSL